MTDTELDTKCLNLLERYYVHKIEIEFFLPIDFLQRRNRATTTLKSSCLLSAEECVRRRSTLTSAEPISRLLKINFALLKVIPKSQSSI